jgi:hypothetical protein
MRLLATFAVAIFFHALDETVSAAEPSGRLGKPNQSPRKVFAFYYPWYGNPKVAGGSGRSSHWDGIDESNRRIESSTHYPTLGPYDSHDPKLIARHCRWAKDANLDGFIVSWWGHGTFEDRALVRILDACQAAGLSVAIYYETVSKPRNADAASVDLVALLEKHGGHPAWMQALGKPVVFIYGRAIDDIGLDGWKAAIAKVNARYRKGAVVIGDRLDAAAARVFHGTHTYITAGPLEKKTLAQVDRWANESYPEWVKTAASHARISAVTVIPGYDDTKIRRPGLRVERMNGDLYRAQWEAAISADPSWVLITSWNEWHEGSEIEPSLEHGEQYLTMTAEFAGRFKRRPDPNRQAR